MDPNTNVAPGIGPTPIRSGDSSNSSEATKVEVVAQKAISETKRSSDNCSCFGRAWRVIKIPFSLIYRLFAWIFCCRSKKRQDPFQKCPDVISLTILSYLSFPDLAKVCPVSKSWNALANNPRLLKTSVYRDVAFSHLQWTLCHNQGLQKEEMLKYEHDAKEFESLPPDIGRLLKSSCPAFPGKRVIQTHTLVRLPRGFTLNSLGMLAKKYFPQNLDGYRYIWERIGDRSVRKPTWLLMTKDVLPGSRNRIYTGQQTMVATLATQSHTAYEVPSVIEATACIFANFFRSSTRLFSNDPSTYTRCKDNVEGYQLVVGGFAPSGLAVDCSHYYDGNDDVGVAGLRKF